MREKQDLLRNVNAFAANMFSVLFHLSLSLLMFWFVGLSSCFSLLSTFCKYGLQFELLEAKLHETYTKHLM